MSEKLSRDRCHLVGRQTTVACTPPLAYVLDVLLDVLLRRDVSAGQDASKALAECRGRVVGSTDVLGSPDDELVRQREDRRPAAFEPADQVRPAVDPARYDDHVLGPAVGEPEPERVGGGLVRPAESSDLADAELVQQLADR